MKKNLNISALLALIVLAGCQKEIKTISEPDNMLMAQAAGNINLSVQVDHTTGNKILSDNQTPYYHGTQQVQAQILSSDGNFSMTTNNSSTKPLIRSMQFLIDGHNLGGQNSYSFRTDPPVTSSINDQFGGTKRLHNMDPNNGKQYMQMRVWGVGLKGVINWKLIWKNGYESDTWNTSSISDYVLVTRNQNVWTIEPANFDLSGRKLAALRQAQNDNYNVPPIGYYSMPFKLTLTKIN